MGFALAEQRSILTQRDILDERAKNLTEADHLIADTEIVKVKDLKERADLLNRALIRLKDEAYVRGDDPQERARECGRPWKEGDGY